MQLPFQVLLDDQLLGWRAETFWSKEPETIAWLEDWLSPNAHKNVSCFIDVGANIGLFSLYAAYLNKNLHVIAAEPLKNNQEILIENVKLNHFDNVIRLERKPLHSRNEVLNVENKDERSGASDFRILSEPTPNSKEIYSVTGDELLEKFETSSTIVKIDVDGSELDVILGFNESLQVGKILSILVECSTQTIYRVIEVMSSCGYDISDHYDSIPGHSRHRRSAKKSPEINLVFNRRLQN